METQNEQQVAMKSGVTTIPDAAERKGVTGPAICYQLRKGRLNYTQTGRLRLVHLDDAFEAYVPNPKTAGKRKKRRRC